MAQVRDWRTLGMAIIIACTMGCAKGQYGPSPSTQVRPAPRAINRLSVEERRAILSRAQVWTPIETSSLDLLAGPGGAGSFTPDEAVTCEFVFPDKPLTGATPKFDCGVTPDDVVKVKYGQDNGEVYAEVAGSRLFWALGFNADRMYPVRVTCLKCPRDPFRESTQSWLLGPSSNVTTVRYDPAAIERDFPGKSVEVPGYEGWAWPELDAVKEEAGGAPRAHVDALKLLAVFVQHVDNKPDQQAIKCAPENLGKDAAGNATCSAPLLMVKDLGTTFAAARRISYDKMRLETWRQVPIWRDPAACVGHLIRSVTGNFEDPRISEAGRQFLADRLMLLGDEQVRNLFVAARVERRRERIRDANGQRRWATADDWARTFKEKRDQVVKHKCPN